MSEVPERPVPIKYGWDDIRGLNATEQTMVVALERIMEQLDYIIVRQYGEGSL